MSNKKNKQFRHQQNCLIARTNIEFKQFRTEEVKKTNTEIYDDHKAIYLYESIRDLFQKFTIRLSEENDGLLDTVAAYKGNILEAIYHELKDEDYVTFGDIMSEIRRFYRRELNTAIIYC